MDDQTVFWLLPEGQTYEVVWRKPPGAAGRFVARTGGMRLNDAGMAVWVDNETPGHHCLLDLVEHISADAWHTMRPWRPSPFFAEDLLMLADAAISRVRPLGIRVRRDQNAAWTAFREEVLFTLRRTAARTG